MISNVHLFHFININFKYLIFKHQTILKINSLWCPCMKDSVNFDRVFLKSHTFNVRKDTLENISRAFKMNFINE